MCTLLIVYKILNTEIGTNDLSGKKFEIIDVPKGAKLVHTHDPENFKHAYNSDDDLHGDHEGHEGKVQCATQ